MYAAGYLSLDFWRELRPGDTNMRIVVLWMVFEVIGLDELTKEWLEIKEGKRGTRRRGEGREAVHGLKVLKKTNKQTKLRFSLTYFLKLPSLFNPFIFLFLGLSIVFETMRWNLAFNHVL